MKRQFVSSDHSSVSCSAKSSKRLKLESEIFSTSIQDIENLFAKEITPITTTTTTTTTTSPPPPQPVNNHPSNPESSQYLNNLIPSTNFNYDCINMSFLEERVLAVPTSKRVRFPVHNNNNNNYIRNNTNSMYLDLDEDCGLQNYRSTIQNDLLMIDQLILRQ
ncbi:hypothetical protein G210_1456 [Candida maltosa Xu316]|uniref:Uncharacterized protein n=1 Tax=Candida maltosa (strain Xu316) TaxID=1245528 RepID=M3JYJ6_CANMX|nr:hypothetical protein G210_1456 [Candida maltosa Xu316]